MFRNRTTNRKNEVKGKISRKAPDVQSQIAPSKKRPIKNLAVTFKACNYKIFGRLNFTYFIF